MPATWQWIGGNGVFTNSQNWLPLTGGGGAPGGGPAASDTLVFAGTAPGSYGPPPNPNADCLFPAVPDRFFARIEIRDGYSGTVRFPANVSFGTYLQSAGSTWQATGTAVTVTTGFDWTRGTINTNTGTPAATFNLAAGATGSASPAFTAPFVSGTVSLGSTMVVKGEPALDGNGNPTGYRTGTLTVLSGTFRVVNGDGFVAEEYSKINLQAKTGPGGEVRINGEKEDGGVDGLVTVKPKAFAEVKTTGRTGDTDTAVVDVIIENKVRRSAQFKNLGKTWIHGYTNLKIQGDTLAAIPDGTYYQDHADAMTILVAGSSITTTGKGLVLIDQGKLNIHSVRNADNSVPFTQPVAKIIAEDAKKGLSMAQGTILTMSDVRYNTLDITGQFYTEGEVRLAISRTSTSSDQITATKEVTMDSQRSKLSVRWGDAAAGPPRDIGAKWDLIKSGVKIGSIPTVARIAMPTDPGFKVKAKLINTDKELIAESEPN
ncbi:MAG: hypothetical protein MUF18_07890 [Fimbriiglobus sp.]|nr:hypothetical protein [Fimbriiglobus sp.]